MVVAAPTPSPFVASTRRFAPRLRSLLPAAAMSSAQAPAPALGKRRRRPRSRTRHSRSRGRAGASSPASPASAPRTVPSPYSRRTDTSRPSSPRSSGRSPPLNCGASASAPLTTEPSRSTGSQATTARFRWMLRCLYSWYGAPYPLASLPVAVLTALYTQEE